MRRGKAAAAPAKGAAETAEAGTAAAAAETTAAHPYENSIKTINTVNTVEEFWETYDFLKRPNDLPTTTDYHFFRAGIKPVWEDIANAKGGKWIVRLPKGLASRYWEETMLALIGGQFTGVPDGEICGAVLSIRYNEGKTKVAIFGSCLFSTDPFTLRYGAQHCRLNSLKKCFSAFLFR
jgi:hypothetical protein